MHGVVSVQCQSAVSTPVYILSTVTSSCSHELAHVYFVTNENVITGGRAI